MLDKDKIKNLKDIITALDIAIHTMQAIIWEKQRDIRIIKQNAFEDELKEFLKINSKLFKMNEYKDVYDSLNEHSKKIEKDIFEEFAYYDKLSINRNKNTKEWELELFW